MENDSFKVTETEDGGLELSWDKDDPNWAWANGLTEQELQRIIAKAIQEMVENE